MRAAHPDTGGGAAQAQTLNAAYTLLRDPARRAQYDQERAADEPRQAFTTGEPRQARTAGEPRRRVERFVGYGLLICLVVALNTDWMVPRVGFVVCGLALLVLKRKRLWAFAVEWLRGPKMPG